MGLQFYTFMQLYIKARGLDNVQFGRIVKTENGGHINLSKLREILSALKMPTVQKNPVHLEIIVQIEGKTIFIFFVDQRSFNTLTEGDSKILLKNVSSNGLFSLSDYMLEIFLFSSAQQNHELTAHG